jgi:hypothetical protein
MRRIAMTLICLAVAGIAATAATARTAILSATTGPTPPIASALDDPLFQGPQRSTAFAMASQAGATYARILVSWRSIAPESLPESGFNPTDPSSPYYHFSGLDATIAAAKAHGIQPILDIVQTPTWAFETQPDGVYKGGRPSVTALGQFATALASRYVGTVHAYSVWNEPNFNRNLYPQDPTYYRSMVTAVANAVHGVDPTDLALAGELAPFKHTPTKTDKNNVMPPITFMQKMLCLSTTVPVHRTCSTKSNFDVWTHHPYSDTGPYGKAKIAGGIELGDLPKMDSLLKTAYQLGAITTESGQMPQFWVTEIGWSSKPPNSNGVPIGLETRWVSESFYQVWRSGATLGTWFLLQDEPKSTPFQSGLYYNSDSVAGARVKPLLAAFRMPFVAYIKSGGKVQMWGRDATNNQQNVSIQMKVGSKWKTVASIKSNSNGIFAATMPLHAKSSYSMRANANGVTSAVFSLTKPSNENLNVTPFPLNSN